MSHTWVARAEIAYGWTQRVSTKTMQETDKTRHRKDTRKEFLVGRFWPWKILKTYLLHFYVTIYFV